MAKKYLIQFFHPGNEHNVEKLIKSNSKGKEIIMPWNRDKHARKFIRNNGKYVQSLDGQVHESQIMFWGEWEPPSQVRKINYKEVLRLNKELPRYIHEPVINFETDISKLQNTDPYVFGDKFQYSCCQQVKRKSKSETHVPTKLQSLDTGTIIMFGSCKNKNQFVLDTLLVVNKGIKYSQEEYAHLKDKVSQTYYDAVIQMISDGNKSQIGGEVTNSKENIVFTLYDGIMYDQKSSYNNIYSFFPCLPYKENHGFKRPVITFTEEQKAKYGISFSDTKNTGFGGVNTELSDKDIVELWHIIAKQVIDDNKHCLGIWTKEPNVI